jgi:hypothetical protein
VSTEKGEFQLWPWLLLAAVGWFAYSHKDELTAAAMADLKQAKAEIGAGLTKKVEPARQGEALKQTAVEPGVWTYEGQIVYSCLKAAESGYQVAAKPAGWQKRGELYRFHLSTQFAGWCAYQQNF